MGKEFGAIKLNKGGLTVGENANSCCGCIEINVGVSIIGLLVMITAGIGVWNIITNGKAQNHTNFVMLIIFILPVLYAAVVFFLWFKNRNNHSRRGRLPGAIAMVVISRIVLVGWYILAIVAVKGITLSNSINFLIYYSVEFLVFAYYYGVVKRFAGK